MDVSILISTRNRAQNLTQTLDSLSRVRRDRLEVELIVIDNGSTDETGAVVAEAARRFPCPLHLLSFAGGGQSAALNYALPTATGRHLVFTDDDLRFDELWLLKLLAPLRAGQAEAVVGEVRLAPHLTRAWMEPIHRAMLAEVPPNRERYGLVGANMAVSRECFDWVTGFDPALGPGALGFSGEELLDRQIRARGGRIQFVEGAVAEHHFDPKRLERQAWIRHAKAMGRSDAYVFHHFDRYRESASITILRRSWHLLLKLTRRQRRKPGSPIDSREIALINYVAYFKQIAILLRTAPKYWGPDRGTV